MELEHRDEEHQDEENQIHRRMQLRKAPHLLTLLSSAVLAGLRSDVIIAESERPVNFLRKELGNRPTNRRFSSCFLASAGIFVYPKGENNPINGMGYDMKEQNRQLVVGILAHVDAGKTTLSEGLLYLCGGIKEMGRVDHGTAFLDTFALERERGITIFSKQAVLPLPTKVITLLDTPGHVDFSAEMERTLQVLDYAILVISATDGVQGHTATLWELLRQYHIPTFLFVNKTDLNGLGREAVLDELKSLLGDGCVDFSPDQAGDAFQEQVARCDETLLNQFLDSGHIQENALAAAIAKEAVFPCYFGSALKLEGVSEFLDGLERYTQVPDYPQTFRAKVFKISHDEQGTRLTWLKLTGGTLAVKTTLSGHSDTEDAWSEKIDQIRIYSGAKFTAAQQVTAGTVCAVTGLTHTLPGDGLGDEPDAEKPLLEPVLTYQMLLPEGTDVYGAFLQLKTLMEEDPQLHIIWNQTLQEIHIQLMGEIQLEIMKRVIADRFGLEVSFSSGNILYKETIAAPVEGVGHFEPLRHYAEVHLLLEPLPRGSGLVFGSLCSQDVLDLNWQRLILTHLMEKEHIGVLTGSPITDMRIRILTGRAHIKHTEGGDFRQATYRAVRHGLRRAQSILLEPWYAFRLELPAEYVGRAIADIQRMSGTFEGPEQVGDRAILTGTAPVATMRSYPVEVAAYTKGHGRLFLRVQDYQPCHNPDEVIAAMGYDPDGDLDNTADSVFCTHGGTDIVDWDKVEQHMHLEYAWHPEVVETEEDHPQRRKRSDVDGAVLDKELLEIFERTYGTVKPKDFQPAKAPRRPKEMKSVTLKEFSKVEEYLLVDGYNIIFAWDDLKELSKSSLDAARERLIHMLSNYQGYHKCHVIVVFDAYKVKGGTRHTERHHNVDVVYTQEAETADTYIEKASYQLGKKYRVRVATSDHTVQMIILGNHATRISASAFRTEVDAVNEEIDRMLEHYRTPDQPLPFRK